MIKDAKIKTISAAVATCVLLAYLSLPGQDAASAVMASAENSFPAASLQQVLKEDSFDFARLKPAEMCLSDSEDATFGDPQASQPDIAVSDGMRETEDAEQESPAATPIVPKVAPKAAPRKPAIAGVGIGLPGPVLAKTKRVDGRRVCANKNDHPSKSKKNPKGHIDGECCLDPDETPNSNCYYPQKKYADIIRKYLDSKRK